MNSSRPDRCNRITAMSLGVTMAVSGAGLLGLGVQSAQAAPKVSAVSAVQVGMSGITAEQWRSIAESARANGDVQSARAASTAAGAQGGVQLQSWSSWTKKAIKAALKYGKAFLPQWLRPWADRLYSLIDMIDSNSEIEISLYLVSQGFPPPVAQAIAQWLNVFR